MILSFFFTIKKQISGTLDFLFDVIQLVEVFSLFLFLFFFVYARSIRWMMLEHESWIQLASINNMNLSPLSKVIGSDIRFSYYWKGVIT